MSMMSRTNTVRKGDCGKRTKELIARYYLEWRGYYCDGDNRLYLSMDKYDMYHKAITLILQDSSFRMMKTDEEILTEIKRQIRNVATEIIRDHQSLYKKKEEEEETRYADYIQTETETGGQPEEEGAHGHLQLGAVEREVLHTTLCEMCEKKGIVKPADDVHHIQSFMEVDDQDARRLLAFDFDNLMSLCDECHSEIHKRNGCVK